MISEKRVASIFNGFWSECLPLLTPSFVRVFNEAYSEELTDLPNSRFSRIEIGKEVSKHDLVAELSFCLAEIFWKENIKPDEITRDSTHFNKAYLNATNFLKKYKAESEAIQINDAEHKEANEIAKQYSEFFKYKDTKPIIFRPKIKGSGFLRECRADLSIGDTLYEVKAINRNLSGKDIKQLLIYLALNHESRDMAWHNAGFFNPRKALHYTFSIDHLIYRTSGGRTTPEVFNDIIDFLASREIELDTAF